MSYNIELVELPDTIWELYNLQLLNLLETFIRSIKGIRRLTNLRHIEKPRTILLCPKKMVRLRGLRTLKSIIIDVDDKEAFSLEHLKNFNQLDGSLKIKWSTRGDGNVEDANKRHITRLLLNLMDKEIDRRKKQDEDLVEALNMPRNLETLQIYH